MTKPVNKLNKKTMITDNAPVLTVVPTVVCTCGRCTLPEVPTLSPHLAEFLVVLRLLVLDRATTGLLHCEVPASRHRSIINCWLIRLCGMHLVRRQRYAIGNRKAPCESSNRACAHGSTISCADDRSSLKVSGDGCNIW